MDGQRKATAWCGRLLLFAALLLGIVTMHTLGHPTEQGESGIASHAMAMADAPVAVHTRGSAPDPVREVTPDGPVLADREPHGTGRILHGESHGMDPMSVCLAVLGSALPALVLLLGVAALRRPAAVLAVVRARLLAALRPIPPPPRHKALARLSVLRV
ncbi:DUF6153 family protein [Streptomyces olivoreticuli]